MLELVVFDVDGLMIDTESVWKDAFDVVGNKYGISNLGDALFSKLVGKRLEDEKEAIDEHIPSEIQEELLDEWREIGLRSLEREVPVKPGLYEILDFLEENHIKMAVATTTRRELTEQRLKKIGVFDRFDYVLCGDEVTKRKPNPEIYETVLKKMGVKPENCIVLEDSKNGIRAAYNANMRRVWIPDQVQFDEEDMKYVDLQCKDLKRVIDILEAM